MRMHGHIKCQRPIELNGKGKRFPQSEPLGSDCFHRSNVTQNKNKVSVIIDWTNTTGCLFVVLRYSWMCVVCRKLKQFRADQFHTSNPLE